jgi:hypothetical protein
MRVLRQLRKYRHSRLPVDTEADSRDAREQDIIRSIVHLHLDPDIGGRLDPQSHRGHGQQPYKEGMGAEVAR